MNTKTILDCEDIEELKRLCVEQNKQLAYISEILVEESKWHISSDVAIQKIREYLVKGQNLIEIRCL